MTAAYLILYEGEPADAEAFFDYYVEQHVPLLWRFPRIRGIDVMRHADDGDFFLVTRLLFDNVDDLRAAVTSDHRDTTKADMENFPAFSGTVRWQVCENYEFEAP